jgi:hypothetical protein
MKYATAGRHHTQERTKLTMTLAAPSPQAAKL